MLDWLVDGLGAICGFLADHLPQSPFQQFADTFEGFGQALGYLNWLVPIGGCLGIMAAWLAAILAWRAIRFVIKSVIGKLIPKGDA